MSSLPKTVAATEPPPTHSTSTIYTYGEATSQSLWMSHFNAKMPKIRFPAGASLQTPLGELTYSMGFGDAVASANNLHLEVLF